MRVAAACPFEAYRAGCLSLASCQNLKYGGVRNADGVERGRPTSSYATTNHKVERVNYRQSADEKRNGKWRGMKVLFLIVPFFLLVFFNSL